MTSNDAKGHARRTPRGNPGFLETSRRGFLKGAGAAGVTTMLFPRLGWSSPTTSDVTLVVVNLRGAADLWGSMCPPVADSLYQSERSTLAIPAPGVGNQTIWLPSSQHGNQRFGLAEAALGLQPALNAGKLALVSGVGLPGVGRSHFEAMREVEFGIDAMSVAPPGAAGWGGGMLNQASPTAMAPVRGLAHGGLLPTTLLNGDQVQAVKDVTSMIFPGDLSQAYPGGVSGASSGGSSDPVAFASTYRLAIELLHSGAGTVQAAGTQAIAAFDYLDGITYSALPSSYPSSAFGAALHNTAVILQTPSPRPELIHIDFGGWDHHEDQGSNDPAGLFWNMCKDLCDAIGAFYAEMQAAGPQSGEHLLMVYSEFGRRLRTNSAEGTDHGHGNAMLLLGDAVSRGMHGGKIYAEYGPLTPGVSLTGGQMLVGDEDLVITIENRDVLREFFKNSLNMDDTQVQTVFHGWTTQRTPATALNLLG